MTATFVPAPPIKEPLVDSRGFVTLPWRNHFLRRHEQAGSSADKIDAAHSLAVAAVPQTTQVVGAGGLRSVGNDLSGNVGVVFYRIITTVALLPTSGNTDGDWAYGVNGRKPGEGAGAGTGVPVFWSHRAWVAVTSGATVTA